MKLSSCWVEYLKGIPGGGGNQWGSTGFKPCTILFGKASAPKQSFVLWLSLGRAMAQWLIEGGGCCCIIQPLCWKEQNVEKEKVDFALSTVFSQKEQSGFSCIILRLHVHVCWKNGGGDLKTDFLEHLLLLLLCVKFSDLYAKEGLIAIKHLEPIASWTLVRDYVTEITVSNYEHDIFNFIWLWDHPTPPLSSSWEKIKQYTVKGSKKEHIIVTKQQSQITTQTYQTPTRNFSYNSPMPLQIQAVPA